MADLDDYSIQNQLNGLQVDDDDYQENEDDIVDTGVVDVEDDEDDEEEDESGQPVTLGFVEKPKHSWSLLRHFFPSKAGGIPAWLDPVDLPSGTACLCDLCGVPLQFVLQVYAPLTHKETTFHRILYVFMCTSMTCLLRDQHEQWKRHPDKASRSVKVFRCQLPRFNNYYSPEPPKYDGSDKPSRIGAVLCNWCGTWKGNKVCGNCRSAHYCSENHQAIHWRTCHKSKCPETNITSLEAASGASTSKITSHERPKAACKTLWPEYEIIQEDECEFTYDSSGDNDYCNSLVRSEKIDSSMNSLMDSFEGDSDKKSWVAFQERIGKAPEQVLRYCRGPEAKPLWPMSSGHPSKSDIPKCNHCGGLLTSEFQILPQLLYYFWVKNDVDSLDWATIAVFTCQESCDGGTSYKDEYAWVQLSSQSTTRR